MTFSLTSSVHSMLKSLRNFSDTAVSASTGHGKNQSMVQPLISPGNCCALCENLGPTGEKHRQVCRLARTLSKKNLERFSWVSTMLGASFFITGRMSPRMASISSLGKSPEISPVISIWLITPKRTHP